MIYYQTKVIMDVSASANHTVKLKRTEIVNRSGSCLKSKKKKCIKKRTSVPIKTKLLEKVPNNLANKF